MGFELERIDIENNPRAPHLFSSIALKYYYLIVGIVLRRGVKYLRQINHNRRRMNIGNFIFAKRMFPLVGTYVRIGSRLRPIYSEWVDMNTNSMSFTRYNEHANKITTLNNNTIRGSAHWNRWKFY